MAKTKAALGIEVSGDELRLALVEHGDQGISLLRTQVLRAGEDLGRQLRTFPRRPSAVACSVSLEHAGIRVLSLPPTTDENLERLVTLEAEAALPLASDDLALSHHVLGMTEQSRLEVTVAAARLSVVQELLGRVSGSGFSGSPEVTVTSAALINSLGQLRGSAREPVCAVLRVEANESELLVLDRNRVVLAQFLTYGCGGDAGAPVREPVLMGAASGSGGGAAVAEPGLDPVVAPVLPWVAGVSQQVRYLLQALSYDRGLVTERLYLCGEGAIRSGAQWQLSERLDLPVSFLSPGVGGGSGDGGDGAQFAVAFGCAIQALGEAILPLNLTPARVVVEREVEQRRQTRLSWGALIASIVVAGSLVFGAMLHNRQQALADVERKLADLGPLATQRSLPGAGDPKLLKDAAAGIGQSLAVRVPPAEMLSMLSQALPAGTWLAELTYNSETGCTIRGYATDEVGPQQALVSLLQMQKFDDVTLDYRTQELLNKVPVWSFQLSCKLRPREVARRGRTQR